ncbi:MAG: ATP-dependent zinc metalloprotease FtsH [bacterium]
MNKFAKNIGVYILLIVVSILIAQFFMDPPTREADINYTQLVNYINSGEINQIKVIGEEKVTGEFSQGEFEVAIPDYQTFYRQIEESEVDINSEPEPSPPWWLSILGYALPVIILIGAWFFIMQRMQGGGGKMMSFGKSKAKLNENKGDVDFSNVANYEEIKEELQEVVEFLKNPGKFAELGAKVPKGVLMVGPPGTGKTLMAKAVAGEAGVPFYFISGSDFVEMFVGVGASRVRDLFEKGKENAPCIIFVDELDAVGRQRGAGVGGGHDEREQTLNQLLVEMDGFEPNEGIILMAATNRPDILDPALLRPGRFDRQVIVHKPDRHARQKILEIHIQDKPVDDDVKLDILSKRTPGFTGADMENLANEAAILAARRRKNHISMVEFDDAIDRVIAGPARKSRLISDEEKNLVAYHETGHALLGELLEHADRTHKVSIIPRGQAGGFTVPLPEEEKNFKTKSELMDQVTALLGGRVAESIFLDDISTGAQNDLERATKIVRAMITEYGMSDKLGPLTLGQKHDEQVFLGRDISRSRNFSEEVAAKIDEEINSYIERCYDKANDLLSNNKDTVERIVTELKERETLDSEQIQKIIKGEPLPEPEEDEGEKEKSNQSEEEKTDHTPDNNQKQDQDNPEDSDSDKTNPKNNELSEEIDEEIEEETNEEVEEDEEEAKIRSSKSIESSAVKQEYSSEINAEDKDNTNNQSTQ